MKLSNRLAAEFVGTFWLVLGGCSSAVLAAAFPGVGIGLMGVSLAFGLTVLTMAYAIGHISGCHLNPAVSVGLAVGGRFKTSELIPYIIAQLWARSWQRVSYTSSRAERLDLMLRLVWRPTATRIIHPASTPPRPLLSPN